MQITNVFSAHALDAIFTFVYILFIAMPLQLYLSITIMVNNYRRYILAGDITGNFLGFRMKKC